MKTFIWWDQDYDSVDTVIISAEDVEAARMAVIQQIKDGPEEYRNGVEYLILHDPDYVLDTGVATIEGYFRRDSVYTTVFCDYCGKRAHVLDTGDLPADWVRRRYESPELPKNNNVVMVTVTGMWYGSTNSVPHGIGRKFDSEAHADAWEAENPRYKRIT